MCLPFIPVGLKMANFFGGPIGTPCLNHNLLTGTGAQLTQLGSLGFSQTCVSTIFPRWWKCVTVKENPLSRVLCFCDERQKYVGSNLGKICVGQSAKRNSFPPNMLKVMLNLGTAEATLPPNSPFLRVLSMSTIFCDCFALEFFFIQTPWEVDYPSPGVFHAPHSTVRVICVSPRAKHLFWRVFKIGTIGFMDGGILRWTGGFFTTNIHLYGSPSERKWHWGIIYSKKKGGFAVPSQPYGSAPRWKSFVVDSGDSPRLRLALALPVLFSSTAEPGTDGVCGTTRTFVMTEDWFRKSLW